MLFGPLVLVPQLLSGHATAVRTGLILSALPAGFGLAALTAEAVVPPAIRNRTRDSIGAGASALTLVMLIFMSSSTIGIVVLLGLTGLCLGVAVPANSALIMRTGDASSAATLGGVVNMTRGIGTTLGIALVTVALHVSSSTRSGTRHPAGTLGLALLAAAGACAAVIATAIRPLGNGPSDETSATAATEHAGAFG